MILPFANTEYFIIAAIAIIILMIFRFFFKKKTSFNTVLLTLSALFIAFYYPKPINIAIFVVYSYLVYYFFNKVIKLKNKLIGTLFILVPMIIVKSGITVHHYPYDVSNWMSFAGLSYISFRVVSVYIEAKPKDKPVSLTKYLNFLLFTPTLLIGPIDRFNRFSKDLDNGYSNINLKNISKAIEYVILGVAYKYIFAEIIQEYWLNIFPAESTNGIDMVANMYGYYIYLFFDFAGYSAMAIGIGKFMGIDVPINFNKPFLARNPQDFWRRFHKTLGDWLRDYFFMPFYKFFTKQKRLKKLPLLRQNISLFATFLLMGVWNGFTKHFILSGVIFAIYSVVHNSYIHYSKKKQRDIVFGTMNEKYVKWISIVIMFNLAAFSIYIFSGRFPYL
jgi:membrane protein involved in D-alanine export